MYFDYLVEIPKVKGKIYKQIRKDVTYVHFEYAKIYKPEKKYNIPKRTTIGKVCSDNPEKMYPNPNYLKYFPEAEIPEEKSSESRSSCLHIGAHIIIMKIIKEYGLEKMIEDIIGKDSGLFMDLVAYTIIAENNAGQYYPDYAYNHPLMTKGMHIFSDSKVSDFINSISIDQSVEFLNKWNENRNFEEKIYISYDSTNKSCQAGDVGLAEFGHSKDGSDKPQINYAIAYDVHNREPLFYEDYPGSIVDVSQLQFTLEKTKSYGYKNVGFIIDRGYFSKANIKYMDKCGYDFVIMMKGMKTLAQELILSNKNTFEDKRKHSIRKYKTSGITVKSILYPSDRKERYFHVFYSTKKHAGEREVLETKIDRYAKQLEKYKGKVVKKSLETYEKYFDLIFHDKDEVFVGARERTDVIDREINLCGYFLIITSEKMSAVDALSLYKQRDASEKLFRGDKSYLGNKSFRVHSDESVDAKIFMEFVALIVRNKIYTSLKDKMLKDDKKSNYMTVPAALKELEKIEMVKRLDGIYRLDHAVSSNQKEILKAFGIKDVTVVKKMAEAISKQL